MNSNESTDIQIEHYEYALKCAEYLGFTDQCNYFRDKILHLKQKEIVLQEMALQLAYHFFTATLLKRNGIPVYFKQGQIFMV